MQEKERFPLLPVITAIFVVSLVLVPSTAAKFIAVGPFAISGATLVYPISFIFNDILTEVYGYERSRRIIWLGLGVETFAAAIYTLIGYLPPAPFWHNQAAFDAVLGQAPRIVVASLTAYFFSEFANSFILSKMKFWQAGRQGLAQAGRFIASTFVGQFFDSIIFIAVGFYGTIQTPDLIKTIVTIWLAKSLYEVIALPFSMRFSNWIKRREGVDHIDAPDTTRYSPFHF